MYQLHDNATIVVKMYKYDVIPPKKRGYELRPTPISTKCAIYYKVHYIKVNIALL